MTNASAHRHPGRLRASRGSSVSDGSAGAGRGKGALLALVVWTLVASGGCDSNGGTAANELPLRTGVEWQLESFRPNGGPSISVRDPSLYTVRFGADGTVEARRLQSLRGRLPGGRSPHDDRSAGLYPRRLPAAVSGGPVHRCPEPRLELRPDAERVGSRIRRRNASLPSCPVGPAGKVSRPAGTGQHLGSPISRTPFSRDAPPRPGGVPGLLVGKQNDREEQAFSALIVLPDGAPAPGDAGRQEGRGGGRRPPGSSRPAPRGVDLQPARSTIQ